MRTEDSRFQSEKLYFIFVPGGGVDPKDEADGDRGTFCCWAEKNESKLEIWWSIKTKWGKIISFSWWRLWQNCAWIFLCFNCFRNKFRRNMTELWWRSPSWKRSERSWRERSMLWVKRFPRESSLHISVFIIKLLNRTLTAVFVCFRLSFKIREKDRELFKMRDSIQLIQVNQFSCDTLQN